MFCEQNNEFYCKNGSLFFELWCNIGLIASKDYIIATQIDHLSSQIFQP